jgi:hypothetical protein
MNTLTKYKIFDCSKLTLQNVSYHMINFFEYCEPDLKGIPFIAFNDESSKLYQALHKRDSKLLNLKAILKLFRKTYVFKKIRNKYIRKLKCIKRGRSFLEDEDYPEHLLEKTESPDCVNNSNIEKRKKQQYKPKCTDYMYPNQKLILGERGIITGNQLASFLKFGQLDLEDSEISSQDSEDDYYSQIYNDDSVMNDYYESRAAEYENRSYRHESDRYNNRGDCGITGTKTRKSKRQMIKEEVLSLRNLDNKKTNINNIRQEFLGKVLESNQGYSLEECYLRNIAYLIQSSSMTFTFCS